MGNAFKYIGAFFLIVACIGVGALGGCFVSVFMPVGGGGDYSTRMPVGLLLGGMVGIFGGGYLAMILMRK